MNADIGAHGGTTAVTVRLTGQFLPTNTECRIRRSIFDTRQFRDFRHNSVNYMVELRPVHFTAQQGAVQRVQPAPAFQHDSFAVVISRIVNLEETLGATFIINYRTVAFSKAGSGKHQMGVFHDRCALMINHHHQRRFSQRSIHAGSRSVTMQIVFQHHHRVGASGFQFG